jgi:hypothetical protein
MVAHADAVVFAPIAPNVVLLEIMSVHK